MHNTDGEEIAKRGSRAAGKRRNRNRFMTYELAPSGLVSFSEWTGQMACVCVCVCCHGASL